MDPLLQAAEQALRAAQGLIAHSPGCAERYYGRDQTCHCGFYDVRTEIKAVLSRIEAAKGQRAGLAGIVGKWPGEETDQEIEAALKEQSDG